MANDKITSGNVQNKWTVVRILPPDMDCTKVAFLESARIYKILNTADKSFMELLQQSKETKTPVLITRHSEKSDTITSVQKINPAK